METVKKIPYGMSNFEDVIMQNCYYVDKTMYIPLLEDQLPDIHSSSTFRQESTA